MGKVIIETKDKGELKIRKSLTLEQIKKFIEETEKKKKPKTYRHYIQYIKRRYRIRGKIRV